MAGGRGASPFFLHTLYSREQLGSLESCLHHINTNKTPPRLPLSKCQHLLAPEPSANFQRPPSEPRPGRRRRGRGRRLVASTASRPWFHPGGSVLGDPWGISAESGAQSQQSVRNNTPAETWDTCVGEGPCLASPNLEGLVPFAHPGEKHFPSQPSPLPSPITLLHHPSQPPGKEFPC